MTFSRSFRREVAASAALAKEFAGLQTHLGGGMHAKAAQLWCYLLAVQRAFAVGGDLLEIGVFRGWGSFLPAKFATGGEEVVLVDISQHNLDASKRFLVEQAGSSEDRIRCVLADTASTANLDQLLSARRKFRWIHIDGEHSYPAVMADLDAASSLACGDAVICVDDVDHPLAPCIADAVRDWLHRHREWRLLLRGYNKAYLVSMRASLPWSRFVDFLPEVFTRYYGSRVMLASQSQSSDTPYLAYAEPINENAYLKVNRTVAGVEEYDDVEPGSLLLGSRSIPRMVVFGNCQMRVLHCALVHAASAAGMNVEFSYVADVHELTEEDSRRLQQQSRTAVGFIAQKVVGDKFRLRTADLLQIGRTNWIIGVPSMHYTAYWPNHADLQMVPGSSHCMSVDSVIYTGIEAGLGDDEIVRRLRTPSLFDPKQVQHWRELALQRLREREKRDGIDVPIADFLAAHLGGERLFFTFNHPGRQVLDFVLAGILSRLSEVFGVRRPDVLDDLLAARTTLPLDMTTIDFTDILPLRSVNAALGLDVRDDVNEVYRFARPRGSNQPHHRISFLQEVASVRKCIDALEPAQRIFNRKQIAETTLKPTLEAGAG